MKKVSKFLGLILIGAAVSCSKNDSPPTPAPPVTAGYYVLNEGLFNMNNTMLTYYDLKDSVQTTDYFENVNGSKLGDTGNDIFIYGGKLYIVMNVSSYIEVADAATARNITKIDMKDGTGAARQPRYIVGYKNKVLVTSYDGTVAVIDTTTLAAEKFIQVGSTPEQLVVLHDKLYVANSGGLNFPNYDSTLSVVDLNTYTELQKITVGLNPARLTTDNTGKIFILCFGDYGSVAPQLVSVDESGYAITQTVQINANSVHYGNSQLYVFNSYDNTVNVSVLNPADLSVSQPNFITDGTTITTPYGLSFDDENGDVFITDAKDYSTSGEVFCFDKTGKKKFSFSTTPGINPDKVVVIKK